ncbi:hypothetical protein D3C81_2069530 [compost metagenome]
MGLEGDLFLLPQQGRLGIGGGENLVLLRFVQLDAVQKRRQVGRRPWLGQRQQRHAAGGQQQQGYNNAQVFHRDFLSWRSALIVVVWRVKQRQGRVKARKGRAGNVSERV